MSSQHPKPDRQREHQANERTFLAWLRTSVSLIGFGLAIARFGLFLQQLALTLPEPQPVHRVFNSQTIGIGLVVAGILLIVMALCNYNRVFLQIERGSYQPSRLLVWLTAGTVLVLGLLSIPFILWRSAPVRSPHAPISPGRPSDLSRRPLVRPTGSLQ